MDPIALIIGLLVGWAAYVYLRGRFAELPVPPRELDEHFSAHSPLPPPAPPPTQRPVPAPTSKRARQLRNQAPRQFVIFDLETTGLSADRHEIIEIGAIRADLESGAQATFRTFVTAERRISSRITQLTGITQAMVT